MCNSGVAAVMPYARAAPSFVHATERRRVQATDARPRTSDAGVFSAPAATPAPHAKRQRAGHDVSASLVTAGLSAVELKPFLSLPALYALSRMPARRSAAARLS